jgi:hypothetical protein
MEKFKAWCILIGVVVVFLLLIFGLELGGIQWQGFFGVQRANVERKIFETGKSYNEGKAQDLARYKHQYNSSTDSIEKAAIATLIRDSFADFDGNSLRSDSLRIFLNEIMNGGF